MKVTIGENVDTYVNAVSVYDKYVESAKPTVYFLGLCGEVGELCGAIDDVNAIDNKESEWRAKVIDELGDILWYWFALAKHLKLNYKQMWNLAWNAREVSFGEDISTEILRIVADAGRILEHLKKSIRDNDGVITEDRLVKIEQKLVELLEHIMIFSESINASSYETLQKNYEKLFARNEAGTIQGEGDGISREERT